LIPHLVRSVGLAAFGNIAIGLSWANYAVIVVQYAFQLTGPRYLAGSGSIRSQSTVFWNIFSVKLLLFVLLAGCAAIVYTVNSPGSSSLMTYFIYTLLPLGAVFHSGWYLQSLGYFFIVSVVSIAAAVVSLVVGFMLVHNSQHTVFAASSLVIGLFFSGIGTFIVSYRLTAKLSLKHCYEHVKTYLNDGWSVFISQFIASIYMLSGPIIIGWLLDSSSAGAYSAVERLVTSVSSVCLLTHTAAYPKLAALYTTDRVGYARLLKSVLWIYFALATICYGLIICAGPYLSAYLFGSNSQAFGTLIWWGGGLVMLAVFGPLVTGYYVVSGQQQKVYSLTMKVLVISVILGIPGVRYLGVWAWFCALAISQLLVLWTGVQIARKRI